MVIDLMSHNFMYKLFWYEEIDY